MHILMLTTLLSSRRDAPWLRCLAIDVSFAYVGFKLWLCGIIQSATSTEVIGWLEAPPPSFSSGLSQRRGSGCHRLASTIRRNDEAITEGLLRTARRDSEPRGQTDSAGIPVPRPYGHALDPQVSVSVLVR